MVDSLEPMLCLGDPQAIAIKTKRKKSKVRQGKVMLHVAPIFMIHEKCMCLYRLVLLGIDIL